MVEVRVTIGPFTLEIGSPPGSKAAPASDERAAEARALRKALREGDAAAPGKTRRVAATLDSAVEGAEDVTASVERVNELVGAIAKGLTLDPKALEHQLNALLGVLARADREGRYDDELRLARALVALLALLPRWVALVEVLQKALVAARAAGDQAAEGWAHHELGTFALAAEDAHAATHHLSEALRLRAQLGDAAGTNVTRHNMSMLPVALASSEPRERRGEGLRRHPVVVALAILALLTLAGGLALASELRSGRSVSRAEPTTGTTDPGETTETQSGGGTPGGGTGGGGTGDGGTGGGGTAVGNEQPKANDDVLETAEDVPLDIAARELTLNDDDPDGDPLAVSAVEENEETNGAVTLKSGKISYRPAENYNGAAAFLYRVTDGNGGAANASVSVTVTPLNDDPVATADTVQWQFVENVPDTGDVWTISVADLLKNDDDADGDTLTVTAVDTTTATVELLEDHVEHTGQSGRPGSFTYTVSDGNGGFDEAAVGAISIP